MLAQINPTVLPALRFAAIFFFIINLLGGWYIFRNRHRFFDQDPNVDNDIPAMRKLRVEVVMIPVVRLNHAYPDSADRFLGRLIMAQQCAALKRLRKRWGKD